MLEDSERELANQECRWATLVAVRAKMLVLDHYNIASQFLTIAMEFDIYTNCHGGGGKCIKLGKVKKTILSCVLLSQTLSAKGNKGTKVGI